MASTIQNNKNNNRNENVDAFNAVSGSANNILIENIETDLKSSAMLSFQIDCDGFSVFQPSVEGMYKDESSKENSVITNTLKNNHGNGNAQNHASLQQP